jgi:hypothetical protein
LEEAGATPGAQQAQHESTSDGRAGGPPGGPLVVIGVLLVVALIGLVAWTTRGDDALQTVERAGERFPDTTTATESSLPPTTAVVEPATVAPSMPPATPQPTPPPTEPPQITAPPSTVPPIEAPATSVPSTSAPVLSDPAPPPALAGPSVGDLVPYVAAFAEPLATPDAVRAQIGQLLTSPRHDVASASEVVALCAIVPLEGPIAVAGRWEHDGRPVASADAVGRDAPGFGDCVGNDGEPLDDGSYQFIAVDAEGVESAAGGFVVGAERVEQRFTNNADGPVCGVRIAPATSRWFEVYVFDEDPLAPGATITLPVAAVDQDVETMSCRKGEVLATFGFRPDPDREQPLQP